MNPVMMEKLKKEIGERFKVFRKATGKTQEELALELGAEPGDIAGIEAGQNFPPYYYIHFLSKHYHLNINWIFGGAGNLIYYNELDKSIDELTGTQAKIEELYSLLRVPEINNIILARLAELKISFKQHIKDYFEREEKAQKDRVKSWPGRE